MGKDEPETAGLVTPRPAGAELEDSPISQLSLKHKDPLVKRNQESKALLKLGGQFSGLK